MARMMCFLTWSSRSPQQSLTYRGGFSRTTCLIEPILVIKGWPSIFCSVQFSSVARHVQLFATPWTAARQTSLSITNSQSLLKLVSIESVMPSNHLILCRPLLILPSIFPALKSFQMSQLFASGGQSIRVSASASALPINIPDWFPLGLTGWISLQSKGLSRVFCNTTVQKHRFFSAQLFLFISHFSGQWNRDGFLKSGLPSWLRQ